MSVNGLCRSCNADLEWFGSAAGTADTKEAARHAVEAAYDGLRERIAAAKAKGLEPETFAYQAACLSAEKRRLKREARRLELLSQRAPVQHRVGASAERLKRSVRNSSGGRSSRGRRADEARRAAAGAAETAAVALGEGARA